MKKIAHALLCIAALWLAPAVSAQTFDFTNLNFVVGTGTNECALVIAWNDGKTPDNLTWGYRWNASVSGTAPTMVNLIQALQTADPRLMFYANPEYNTPTDYGLYAVFYDLTGSGGTPTVGKPLNQGGSENGTPPYPGDHYREGWYTGFWGILTGSGDPYESGSWADATQGLSGITLTNNSWYGLSFSTDATYPFTIPNPGFPTAVSPSASAVPVPLWAAGICFFALGGVGMFACWKRKPRHTELRR